MLSRWLCGLKDPASLHEYLVENSSGSKVLPSIVGVSLRGKAQWWGRIVHVEASTSVVLPTACVETTHESALKWSFYLSVSLSLSETWRKALQAFPLSQPVSPQSDYPFASISQPQSLIACSHFSTVPATLTELG